MSPGWNRSRKLAIPDEHLHINEAVTCGGCLLDDQRVVGRGLTFWQAGRAKDIHSIHALLQVSKFFELYALIPVSVAVLVFGLIVPWMQKWPPFRVHQ